MENEKPYNKKIRLISTMVLTCMAFAVNYLISLVLVPYIAKYLGADANGYVLMANNFASYAAILTTALNSYAARYISVEYHKGNLENANRYYTSVFYGDLVLVAGIAIIYGIITFFLDSILKIPENLVMDTKILFLLVFVNFAFLTIGTAFTAVAQIKNHLDLIGLFKGASGLGQVIVMVILFRIFGANLWIIGLGYAAAGLIIFVTNLWMTNRYTPDLVVKKTYFSLGAVKELVVNGVWNSINSLGNTLNSGLDLIVCNLMLSNIDQGNLSYAKTIGVIFATLFALVSYPFQPLFLKHYSDGDMEGLIKEFKFSMKSVGMISEIAFAGFIALGMTYLKAWIPMADHGIVYILCILTIICCLGEGVVSPLYYAYTLKVKNKIPCIVTVTGGLLNVLGMYLLIRFTGIGVYAIVITTAVISTVTNLVFHPIYAAKCLGIKVSTFYPEIIKHLFMCGLLTAVFYGISFVINPSGWVLLIVCAGLYAVIGIIIQIFILFGKDDRKKIIGKVLKK